MKNYESSYQYSSSNQPVQKSTSYSMQTNQPTTLTQSYSSRLGDFEQAKKSGQNQIESDSNRNVSYMEKSGSYIHADFRHSINETNSINQKGIQQIPGNFVQRPPLQSSEDEYTRNVAEGFRSEKVRDDIMRRSFVQVVETEKNTFSLSKDINMTVLMMAVEIERLNGEVDAWKLRYTDLDRRISDRSSVEDALRAESLKILELKNQIKHLLEEKESSGNWQKEIESWKHRYTTLERTKDKEMEDLRLTFDARRKSYIEREIKDVTLRFNMERNNWENDMRKLRDLLESRTRELEEWKNRFGKLEISISEMKGNQGKLLEYENRLALMSSEIERLNEIMKKKSQEIEEWRLKYSKLETNLNQGQAKDSRIHELESILSNMQREIDRLTGILREKDSDFEREKVKRSKLESDLSSIRVLEIKIQEYENKIAMITTEIERLNITLMKEREEKERLKGKLIDFESNSSGFQIQLKQWESRYNESMREIEEWKKRYGEIQITINEYRSYEVKVREYENKLALMSSEMQRLNEVLSRGKGENESLRARIKEYELIELKIREYENKIALLTSEIERLNSVIKNRGDDLDSWKNKYSKLEISINEYRGLEGRLRDYESSIAGMQREIERLNGLLRDRHEDLEKEKVKRSKLESDVSTIKVFEMRIQEYENKIAMLTSEIQRLNDQLNKSRNEILEYRGYEARIKEYENKIAMISSENERLNGILRKEREETKLYRMKISEYETIMKDIPGLQGQVKQWESRYNLILKELDDWKKKHGDLFIQINEFNEVRKRITEFETLAFLLYSEIERLNTLLVKERDEKEGLKRKCFEFEHSLQEVPHLQMIIKQWESRFTEINKELDDWKKRHGDLNIRISEYRTLEMKIQDYEGKIALLSSEIERLNSILKNKSDDIEQWKKKYSTLEITLVESRSMEMRLKEYENNMNGMQREIERLNGLLHDRHQDLEKEKVKRSKLETEMSTIKILELKIQEYENKFAMLTPEIERLNRLVMSERAEKEKIIVQLHLFEEKIKEYENRIAMLSSEIERLNSVLRNRSEDIESWKNKYMKLEISYSETRGLEGKLHEYEQMINMLRNENDKMNGNMKSELDMWRKRYSDLEIQMTEYKSYELKLREYENKLAMLSSELERMKVMSSKKSEEIEVWKSKCYKLESSMSQLREYEIKIQILAQEIDRLNEEHKRDEEEITIYKNKWVEYSSLNNKINEHMLLFVLLSAEIEALRTRVKEKENEVEEVRRQSLTPFRKSVAEIQAEARNEIYQSESRKSGLQQINIGGSNTIIKSEYIRTGGSEVGDLSKSGQLTGVHAEVTKKSGNMGYGNSGGLGYGNSGGLGYGHSGAQLVQTVQYSSGGNSEQIEENNRNYGAGAGAGGQQSYTKTYEKTTSYKR